ncbi:MAG: hypothetical protein U0610_21470 [bacterium]
MRPWLQRILGLPLLAALLPSGCSTAPRGPYRVAVDPASRYSFRYVQERKSGKWVHLHCELKVAAARALPEPLSTPETGDRISFTRFNPGSMGTAGIVPGEFEMRGDERVWLYREVAREADLAGEAALSVQIVWPEAEPGPPRREASELFHIPSIATFEPYVWSPWRGPDEVRGGDMPDWERVHGIAGAPAPPIEHPFALRCRTVLSDVVYVPTVADDPNASRPDPSGGGAAPR